MAKKAKAEEVVMQQNESIRLSEPPSEEQVKAVRDAVEKRNSDRLERMNAIADNAEKDLGLQEFDGEKVVDDSEERERQAAKEDEEAKEYAKKLEDESAEPHEEVETKAEDKAEESGDSDTKVVNGVTYYLQIVNGREKWQTLDEIRRTASKVDAADEYLTTAKEAATTASRLALSPKDEPSNVEEDDIEKTLSSAIMGDEEATKKLARALKAKLSAVTPDVLQQVDQRISFRTELAQLESEQRDILDDPWLNRLFQTRLNEMKAENAQTPIATAYRTIGKELRSAFPEKFKKASVSQEKLDRKKTLVNAPSAAGRQAERTEEQEEESVELTIDNMAKARNQPHAIRSARH